MLIHERGLGRGGHRDHRAERDGRPIWWAFRCALKPGQRLLHPADPQGERATDDLFGSKRGWPRGRWPLEEALAICYKPVLEDPAVLKIGQNMKYDAKILARYGVEVAPIDDTMLLSPTRCMAGLHGSWHGHF